jgi:hypothetical protein
MAKTKKSPVYRGSFQDAALLRAYLEGDGLSVKMVPDVTSEPLQSPAAHNVKSQYKMHLLLVRAEDVERAGELVEVYFSQGDKGGP